MYTKCEAKGKAVFPSAEEARNLMYHWRQPCRDKVSGFTYEAPQGQACTKKNLSLPILQ
ncbi:hypothetical protein [Flavobacterium zepuense]|uniref:hypothetical protein n=1 Tax=Flavobacterium zepuense TaxID=2593302 RepID=UPI00163DE45F|nr:hypothetical protein [Flavobacterium zepuense]